MIGTDMTKQSQCDKILRYLETGAVINTKIARSLFHCERLASRITDLKNRGHNIGRNIVSYKDEEGQTIRYAEYFLIKEVA